MDDYIQEPVETGGFILWKNSQRGEREAKKKKRQLGGVRKACRSLFALEQNQTWKEGTKQPCAA